MSNKLIKFIAAGDNHGDKCDPSSKAALLAYCKEYGAGDAPLIKIHLGDCFDLRALRKGVGATDKEAKESMENDINEGCKFLEDYKPHVYLLGNHEARLDAYINNCTDAMKADKAADMKAAIMRAARKAGARTILPYHAERGIYQLGRISFAHGYAHGANAVAQQGQHYASAGGGFVCGHIHRLEMASLQKWGGGAAYSAGCLCYKDMGYNEHRLGSAKWGSGFAAGWVKGDQWKIWLVHPVSDNEWVWNTQIKVWKP